MSLLKSAVEIPAVAIPFKVRMEPYLVESICELSRRMREKGASSSDISGLLFGTVEPGTRTIEALKTFVDVGAHSELARRQRWEKAYIATSEDAKGDPELSQFEIVGWFSFRSGSGLMNSDVVFHNQHFRKTEDVALIVWREGPSQITAEVYSKSDNDTLTAEDYRWGSVRLSADIRHMRESVELAMRMKLNDDSYLRTYDGGEPGSNFEALKRKAEEVSDKLFGFLNRGKEEAYHEHVRGLIGDGRLPGRAKPMIDAIDPLPNPKAYFNPYSEARNGRSMLGLQDSTKQPPAPPADVPAKAPEPAGMWPASGSGFGTAPARIPEFHPDFRFTQSRTGQPAFPGAAEFDFDQIGRAPRSRRLASEEISGLPMSLRPPTRRKPRVWPWVVGTFLVCVGLVFGFLSLGGLEGDGGRLGQIIQSIVPSTELNLRVRNDDDRLRLTWNQRNKVVSGASDATLQIFDGPAHRDVHLDGRQVADGSVLYKPQTNDVTFRLEVHSDQGSASGSVRVLDGLSGRQPVLDVSSPATGTPSTSPAAMPTDPNSRTLVRDADGSVPTSPETASGAVETAQNTAAPDSTALNPPSTTAQSHANPLALAGATKPPLTGTQVVGPPAKLPYVAPIATPTVRIPARPANAAGTPSQTTHYETPQTIGIQPVAPQPAQTTGGGSTINGWDTAPTKPAAKTGLPGFVGPHALEQVTPNIRSIPAGTIPAKMSVTVDVVIDQTGHVLTARVGTPGVNSQVAAAALAAARQWTFDPARSNGKAVKSYHKIKFEFPAR